MKSPWSLRDIICGLYTWWTAVFFGAVLVDVRYATSLGNAGTPVYAEVSDFLLLLGMPMAIAGLAALSLSWATPSSRNLLGLSILCLSLEFLAPMLLPDLRTSSIASFTGLTSIIRLLPLALASLLAIAAFYSLLRKPKPPYPQA